MVWCETLRVEGAEMRFEFGDFETCVMLSLFLLSFLGPDGDSR